jgi:acyl-CoA dehydrogenase
MDDDLEPFRAAVATFIDREFTPHQERWRARRQPDPEAWTTAGRAGMLLVDLPETCGGGGGTFAHEAIVVEELAKAGVNFANYIQDGVAHYIDSYGTEAQKRDLLPAMARGERVGAVALTEPSGGSDLQNLHTSARRVGDEYVVNGSKTFLTNGLCANLIVLAVRTDPKAPGIRALSLLLVPTDGLAGFHRGQSLAKVGMHGQDTCEVFFDDVRVPASCLLGEVEGQGFAQIMDRMVYERLAIAVGAVATMETAVRITSAYVKERPCGEGTLMELQNTRMKLAECLTKANVGRVFLDACVEQYLAGRLDPVAAAQAKYWLTDRECEVVDECVQLHGGYGYMEEYAIARMWTDSRVHRIYGGANEVLKEMVAWSL